MSIQTLQDVTCPCGETFESELYQSVSIQDDPELKEVVLAGELNVVKCPRCFQMLYAERFVLYHDSTRELMAFVYPQNLEPQRESLQDQMGKTYQALQDGLPEGQKLGYSPFLLFGMDRLCELLAREDDVADEAAVADLLCDQLKLGKRKLRMEFARARHLPPVLPLSAEVGSLREQVLGGLKKLLDANDRLEHYEILRKAIEQDPDWTI